MLEVKISRISKKGKHCSVGLNERENLKLGKLKRLKGKKFLTAHVSVQMKRQKIYI